MPVSSSCRTGQLICSHPCSRGSAAQAARGSPCPSPSRADVSWKGSIPAGNVVAVSVVRLRGAHVCRIRRARDLGMVLFMELSNRTFQIHACQVRLIFVQRWLGTAG